MEIVTLTHGKAKGTSCQIYLFGATLTSWKVRILLTSAYILRSTFTKAALYSLCPLPITSLDHKKNKFGRIKNKKLAADWPACLEGKREKGEGEASCCVHGSHCSF